MSPTSHESRDLLSRFASGDDSALGTLIQREAPRIVDRMRARLPGELRARMGGSDILQLTAVELVRMRERFANQGVGAFRQLVATLADQALARAVEREGAQKRSPAREVQPPAQRSGESRAPGPEPIDTRTPSREAASSEAVERLQACLDELPEADRAILRMVDYEELGFEEASGRLGISIPAAHKRHGRALARLRELMRSRGE